ncbi:hypothetical protein BG003_008299 [Podila horticola]|nr:hypothetical protein BG003_008299 [Podila horticola]
MPCGVPCDRLPCNKRCEKSLACGHRCPSVCGEKCPPRKFCVECKDTKSRRMQVDNGSRVVLGETNVDVNPILVLSCGHAFTMTTLDGMMEMDTYYESEIDPETEEKTYIAKKSLPRSEVNQVSCPRCQTPIMQLLRYGRRIKNAQLSMHLKKHQILQENAMADVKLHFDRTIGQVEAGHNQFVLALSKAICLSVHPPLPETRRLGKFTLESDGFPTSTFWAIAETYNIPLEHRELWFKHIQPVGVVVKRLNEIIAKAAMSPTKKVFEAAVSRFYQLRENSLNVGTDPEKADQVAASIAIQEYIHNCGLPPDGNGGSSYVESLAEKTNALLLVLSEASAVLESVGPLTGWYWFVEDLRNCCLLYVHITMEAALRGHFDCRVAYSRVTLLEILCGYVRWMGLRHLPSDEADKQVRFRRVKNLKERFMEEVEELKTRCPLGIRLECLDRVDKIEKRMVIAVKMARGELNQTLTKTEKLEAFRAISATL